MPVNIFGEWIEEKPVPQVVKPIKVRVVKRGANTLTVILNLNKKKEEIEEMASALKKKLGAGGAVCESSIEIQGDKKAAVEKFLQEKKIKFA